jgi:UPF0755 protein
MSKTLILIIKILIIIGLPLISSVFAVLYLERTFFAPIDPKATKSVIFEIEPNTNFSNVAEKLENSGLIRSAIAIRVLAQLKQLDKKIRVGEYELSPSSSLADILKKLAEGKPLERKITIPEGSNIEQIVAIYKTADLDTDSTLNITLKNPELLTKYNLQKFGSFEGYLFPETYHFPKGSSASDIVSTMVEESKKRWSPAFGAQAEELGLTRHQIITLASIIEKESANKDEQPLIASVFYNRLSRNMKLQSDPTTIYGIPNFDGNLTKEHLQLNHPYNTYTNEGLPPGPICSPGEAAIRAALYPANSSFFYFVGNNKGAHEFSTNYTEHQKLVNKYQKGIS